MKITLLILTTVFVLNTNLFSQNNSKESWSIGFGVSNHTTAGDHRSIMTNLSDGANANNILNLGGYLYVDKMFNPAFGLELKAHYSTMSGAGQEISFYPVQGTSVPLRNTYFKGNAYGAELNLILNLSNLAKNPYNTKPRKWNLASYFGIGLQRYDSKLYDENTNNILIDYGKSPSEDGIANSVYYSFGLGLKYKLSKKLDLEFRPSVNLNQEDHLDAAISSKQNLELFYQVNLGLVYKFNNKEHDNYVWHKEEERLTEEKIDEMIGDAVAIKIKENELLRDSDKDGFTDVNDSCPLKYSKTNNGCPEDSDKDGVPDDMDLCPEEAGLKNNNGCPKTEIVASTTPTTTIINQSNNDFSNLSLFENVYFDLDSAILSRSSEFKLNKVILYMKMKPETSIILQGNTDAGGSTNYNKKLSEKRSNVVKRYIEIRGIDTNRVKVIAYGEEFPKFKNTIINKNNRRVDILINEEN